MLFTPGYKTLFLSLFLVPSLTACSMWSLHEGMPSNSHGPEPSPVWLWLSGTCAVGALLSGLVFLLTASDISRRSAVGRP